MINAIPLLLSLWMEGEIHRLGDERWSVREQASANLRLTLPLSLAFVRASSDHDDPEIANRCRRLAEDWVKIEAEFQLWKWNRCLERAKNLRYPGYGYTPYIDQLPTTWPDRHEVICRYRARAQVAGWMAAVPPSERWYNDRSATALYVADLLMDGKTDQEILALYSRMVLNEMDYLYQRGETAVLNEVK